MTENKATCKRYAEDIENYIFRKITECPYCGETFVYDEYFDEEKSLYVCPHCNKEMDDSDFEPLTIYDYFAVNEYNVVYRINKELEYKSVEIMVGCGGPNVYVDTQEKTVKLSWWGEQEFYSLDADACNVIDEYYEEQYNYETENKYARLQKRDS